MQSITTASTTINVPFHGASLYIVNHNGEPYTPMKPIVEGMGMVWAAQFVKLKQRFAKGVSEIEIPSSGGKQVMTCLALRKLNGWLQTISPNKVKPDIRDRVIQYQEECDDVLYEYWTKGEVSNPRKAPKKEVTAHYLVSVRIRDEITGGQVELNLAAESFVSLVTGISTCLGYEPIGFNKVPVQKSMLRQIH